MRQHPRNSTKFSVRLASIVDQRCILRAVDDASRANRAQCADMHRIRWAGGPGDPGLNCHWPTGPPSTQVRRRNADNPKPHKERQSAEIPMRKNLNHPQPPGLPSSSDGANPSPPPPLPPLSFDAVRDQHGRPWVGMSRGGRIKYVRIARFSGTGARDVFAELADAGILVLTSKAKSDLLREVQALTAYREAVVVGRPGWFPAGAGRWAYAFGDTSIVVPPQASAVQPIMAFDPHDRFKREGTVEAWQASMGPFVAKQPLLLFVLCLACAGPLFGLAPADIENQIIELVGPSTIGKSSLAMLAASVSSKGYDSWLTTPEGIERLMQRSCDALLVLDEANLAGPTPKARRELLEAAAFRFSGGTGRNRLPTGVEVEAVRLAVLSTSNVPFARLAGIKSKANGALMARIVTLDLSYGRPHGLFDFVPHGFEDAQCAVEALRKATAELFGAAHRELVRRLVKARAHDEPKLRKHIEKLMRRFVEKSGAHKLAGVDARAAKIFAFGYAAGILAREYGILPQEWGTIFNAMLRAYHLWRVKHSSDEHSAALRLHKHLEKERPTWIDMTKKRRKINSKKLNTASGIEIKEGGKRLLLIDASALKMRLPDCVAMMQTLRGAGVVLGEGGADPKTTRKAPRDVSPDRVRVYAIHLQKLRALLPSVP